jgi:hypothetical protein
VWVVGVVTDDGSGAGNANVGGVTGNGNVGDQHVDRSGDA